MESASTACLSVPEAAPGCGWSLKKSKHRKSQGAKALKLQQQRGALDVDQDRHQQSQQRQRRSQDIDNIAQLVDHHQQQQHLRRLKQGRADDADSPSSSSQARRLQLQQQQLLLSDVENGLPATPWDFSKQARDGLIWPGGQGGKGASTTTKSKQHPKQSMRAAVESRRRLARGPRSGSSSSSSTTTTTTTTTSTTATILLADVQSGAQPMLPSEDHRVVSTDYQAARTQALMRVTLLAAGFVIGARGISARLIGQVTGAIVQSWTESCRPDSIPIRLFRIQGKKNVVQAAVALIEQAVAKYKDLCECKRRGEFVQREHVISGVEFYYQPPPRKAFANNNNNSNNGSNNDNNEAQLLSNKAEDCPGPAGPQIINGPVNTAATFPPHHVWLQHLQQQQQQQQQQVQAVAAVQQQKQQAHTSVLEATHEQATKGESLIGDGHELQDHGDISHRPHVFFDWQPQVDRQLMGLPSPKLEQHPGCNACAASEFELLDHGLQQSVTSLEQALHQVRLEQRLLQQHNRSANNISTANANLDSHILHQPHQNIMSSNNSFLVENNSLWVDPAPEARAGFHLGPSLFFFGDGGLPALPVSPPDDRSSEGDGNCVFSVDAATTPCTPFDFPHCDFLREGLPNFSWGAAAAAAAVAAAGAGGREVRRGDGRFYEEEVEEGSAALVFGVEEDVEESGLCVVCLERPASVNLVPCGHSLFCFVCVGGLLTCPLCRQPIAALHPRGGGADHSVAATDAAVVDVDVPSSNKLNASGNAFSMWNWIPGASV